VLGWHRKGWRVYWRWSSRAPANSGRRPIRDEVRLLIRRLASENILWSQRRIQADLARLGFKVPARTVAKYMQIAPMAWRVTPRDSWLVVFRTGFPKNLGDGQIPRNFAFALKHIVDVLHKVIGQRHRCAVFLKLYPHLQ
jgi:hypothetical protein